MSNNAHVFGGEQTRIKLAAIQKYLPAYTTALSRQNFRLNYIDAFAGTGVCHINIHNERRLIPGSASIAIDCKSPFHRIFFIEAKKRFAGALIRLSDRSPELNINVIHGDANALLPEILRRMSVKDDRTVVFLDPYGLSVDWTTVTQCASSRLVDLWYLFPLSGVYRQTANDSRNIAPDKSEALNRMLGTTDWRAAFYVKSPQPDFFTSDDYDVRQSDVDQITRWVTQRLKSIFPAVLEPKILYQTLANGRPGAPLFALYFAVANPDPKAWGLALKIAKNILSK
jgi:three-Cys-motif partner protein